MNKKNIYQKLIFISIVVINTATLLNGIKHKENYLIILGAIGLGLILVALIIQIARHYSQKRKQAL